MVTVNADDDIIAGDLPTVANLSIDKTNAYRAGVGQPLLTGDVLAYADFYCVETDLAGAQVQNDEQFEVGFSSPNGDPLPMFMANRYDVSLQLENCALFGNISAGAQLVVPDTTATPAPTPTPTGTGITTPSATEPPITPGMAQVPYWGFGNYGRNHS
jgi:hypothetical protein